MEIKHKGKTINTIHYTGKLELDKIHEIQSTFYKEDKTLMLLQLRKFLNGGSVTNHIYNYYFERIANDTILEYAKWSINELLECPELVQMVINATYTNPGIFDKNLLSNFKRRIALGGKGVACKPPQFPIKTVVSLLERYLPNGGNYFDPCAGWGARLLGAAQRKNVAYFACDVNDKLVPQLQDLAMTIDLQFQNFEYDINIIGAEVLQENYIDRMDFAFTSPPYFDLENYNNGEQSIKDRNYPSWINQFLIPMFENTYKYLKTDSYFLVNINNYKNYDLVGDTIRVAEQIGFVYKGHQTLSNIKRINANGNLNDNSEKILIFHKRGELL